MSDTITQSSSLKEHRILVIVTVMLVAILEVLDSTIVNVSLPHMMGELGANVEQITWVLTSYIVASAIVMPLTGLLVTRLGRKNLLLINIMGFMVSSILCGLATSLPAIVTFRVLQGAFGAALIPLSQVILNDTFEDSERTKAMAIWGIGLMAAPVLGPSLGGYITEHLNWRWVFFINIPGCLLSFFLASFIIPKSEKRFKRIDWVGLILMAAAIGGFQLVLDQGNTKDWFNSDFIFMATVVTAFAMATFITRGRGKKDHIINLALFRHRNFTTSTVIFGLFCGALFGSIGLQPIMLERLMGYSALDTGLIMAPRGIACAVGMAMVTPLMSKYSSKSVLVTASLLCSLGTYVMVFFSTEMNMWSIIWPSIIQGFGMGLFFVPLSTVALAGIPEKDSAEAAGLFGYGRMVGSSIGISVLSTLVNRQTQVNWSELNSYITPYNATLNQWLSERDLSLLDPTAMGHIVKQIASQANMIAYNDGNLVVACTFLVLIPFIFLLHERPKVMPHE